MEVICHHFKGVDCCSDVLRRIFEADPATRLGLLLSFVVALASTGGIIALILKALRTVLKLSNPTSTNGTRTNSGGQSNEKRPGGSIEAVR